MVRTTPCSLPFCRKLPGEVAASQNDPFVMESMVRLSGQHPDDLKPGRDLEASKILEMKVPGLEHVGNLVRPAVARFCAAKEALTDSMITSPSITPIKGGQLGGCCKLHCFVAILA